MASLAINFQDILKAQKVLSGVANKTPVMTSSYANTLTNAELFFKCENFQKMGAFKFRGAYYALSRFTSEQKRNGVVAFSSGNHAQAIALAATTLGIKSVIVMPSDAPEIKVAATKDYGGEVIFYDRYKEDREAISQKIMRERKMTLIPPFDHPDIMAGQGTAAKELVDEVEQLDLLIAPVGGGGLISGTAIALKTMLPQCKVIGVEPESGNDAQRSFNSGRIIQIDVPQTIADGAQNQYIGKQNFPVIKSLVDEILTVSDKDLIDTMKFFASRMKIIVEPTGCLGAAAAFSGQLDLSGKRVGVLLSGGNVDLARFAKMVKE